MRVKVAISHGYICCFHCGQDIDAGSRVAYVGGARPAHPLCAYRRLKDKRRQIAKTLDNARQRLLALAPEIRVQAMKEPHLVSV